MNSKLFCLVLLLAVLVPSIHSQTCYVDSFYNITTSSCNPCSKTLNQTQCVDPTCVSYYWTNETSTCNPTPICGTGFWFNTTSQKCIDCTTFDNLIDCNQCPGFGFNVSLTGKCQAPIPCEDAKFYDFNTTTCMDCNGTGNITQPDGNVSTICGLGACHSHFWALFDFQITYLGQTVNITNNTCYACSMIENTLPGGLTNSVNECACNLGFFWNPSNLTCDDCTTANDTTCFLCNNFVLYNSSIGVNCSLCANVENSNGGYNAETGTCNCAIGFAWSVGSKKCVACGDVTSEFECLAASCLGYYFVNGVCGACGDIEGTVFADNENSPPSKECICDIDTIWFVENTTAAPVCAPCNTVNASVNGTKCGTGSCINFIYSLSQDSCVDNCTFVPDYNVDYPTIINGGCICNAGFFFFKDNFTCNTCGNATTETECLIDTCADFWWVSTKSTCITCADVVNVDPANNNMTNGVCICLDGYLWNSTTKKCDACTSATVDTCGFVGCSDFFFNKQTKKCRKCPALATKPRGSNVPNTICDCPTLTMWSPKTISCVACNFKIGQALNNETGACINCNNVLNKHPLKTADTISKNDSCFCASNYTFINGKCGCNDSKSLYDMGNAAGCGTCAQIAGGSSFDKTTGGCKCIASATWNNITKKCACKTPGQFLNGKTCTSCSSLGTGLTTGSNSADPFSCICATGLSWNTTLKTCLCTDITNIWSESLKKCDSCAKAAYYSKGTSNGQKECACNSNMIWNKATSTCICDTKSIPKGTSKLYCIACSSVIGSSGAKIGTGCGCKAGWTWNSNLQICACTTTTCTCPTDFALINKICTNCSTVVGSTGKASSNLACGCKKSFIWDALTSKCVCPTGGMTNSAKSVCTFCDITANAYNYTTAAKTACNCTTNYLWDGVALTCKFVGVNAIIMLANGTKKSCAGFGGSIGSSIDNFNCRCPVGSIWNTNTNKCVACNTIPFTNTTGATKNFKYSCPCNNGTSWDLLTFTCRNNTCKNLPFIDSRCGYCLVATGVEQVPQLLSVSIKTDTFQLSGDNEFIAEMNARSVLYGNYTSLKCKCKVGYSWNVARRSCFNTTTNSTY